MRTELGSRIGPYEVPAALDAGGMGEVWRARDPRLGRDVAIKTLTEEFARDPELLARLKREARLLASLRHPGINTIYGLEEIDGQGYLVLECVRELSAVPSDRTRARVQRTLVAWPAVHACGITPCPAS